MQRVAVQSALFLAMALVASAAGDWLGMPFAGSWLLSPAEAVVGMPLTPMSYAGVARRTARRTAYYGAAMAAPPMAAPVAVVPAAVPVLPAGCGPYGGGVYNCGGAYYRPAYQGANVVYVPVQAPY